MLQSVPQRTLSKPRLLCTLKCLTPVLVQVVGPNTLYLAETDSALMQSNDQGTIDALQINQASGIMTLWWVGDLWAAGSAPFAPLIIIPGINTGSGIVNDSSALNTQGVMQ